MRKNYKEDFYQYYPDQKSKVHELHMAIYENNKNPAPISDAEVTVFASNGGKRKIIYKGKSGKDGICIPCELPECMGSMFCICARHETHLPKNEWINVKTNDNTRIKKAIEMKERLFRHTR